LRDFERNRDVSLVEPLRKEKRRPTLESTSGNDHIF
jgi:hypothetical protein